MSTGTNEFGTPNSTVDFPISEQEATRRLETTDFDPGPEDPDGKETVSRAFEQVEREKKLAELITGAVPAVALPSSIPVEYHVEATPDADGNVQLTVPPHIGETVKVKRVAMIGTAGASFAAILHEQPLPNLPPVSEPAFSPEIADTFRKHGPFEMLSDGPSIDDEPTPTPLNLELIRRQAAEIEKLWKALDATNDRINAINARIASYNTRASHKL